MLKIFSNLPTTFQSIRQYLYIHNYICVWGGVESKENSPSAASARVSGSPVLLLRRLRLSRGKSPEKVRFRSTGEPGISVFSLNRSADVSGNRRDGDWLGSAVVESLLMSCLVPRRAGGGLLLHRSPNASDEERRSEGERPSSCFPPPGATAS